MTLLGHLTRKIVSEMSYNVSSGALNRSLHNGSDLGPVVMDSQLVSLFVLKVALNSNQPTVRLHCVVISSASLRPACVAPAVYSYNTAAAALTVTVSGLRCPQDFGYM